MGNHSGAEGTSEGGHRDTHSRKTSRQDRRVHEVYDRLTRIAKASNSGRGVAEFVSVPEEPYEGNPHVRFCEGGPGCVACHPSTRPALPKQQYIAASTVLAHLRLNSRLLLLNRVLLIQPMFPPPSILLPEASIILH